MSQTLTKAIGQINRNRLLNPDGYIDQRNNGTSVTPGVGITYTVDRMAASAALTNIFSVQQNTTTSLGANQPTSSSIKLSVVTQYSSFAASDNFEFGQTIETCNMRDSFWGTSNANSFVFTIAIYAPVAGAYSISFRNMALIRSYVTTITVANANTLEFHSIVVPGDTTGTWSTTYNAGHTIIDLDLGAGTTYSTSTLNTWQAGNFTKATGSLSFVANTAGTSMYIAWMQFEPDFGTLPEIVPYEKALKACQRYYETIAYNGPGVTASNVPMCVGHAYTATSAYGQIFYSVPKRATVIATYTGSQPRTYAGVVVSAFAIVSNTLGYNGLAVSWTGSYTAGNAVPILMGSATSGTFSISAEL